MWAATATPGAYDPLLFAEKERLPNPIRVAELPFFMRTISERVLPEAVKGVRLCVVQEVAVSINLEALT